ncbi:hypothetical protein SAMN05192588_1165 [Nonlabens sp. Hel1_33_55]|uniref:hypothetical protein n=1 Tax=Nonlabens sp. Hel1_33_55 TaxID=1336802 RepID=UPI000875EAA2|nr:hypothetical protein [Nonlabens sp. Hel1_33_55]SCY10309.1 hypothetical protein SAMN05192588_1165 [Nonlabens sp. Hel1_33_55]
MTRIAKFLFFAIVVSSCSGQENLREYYYSIGDKEQIQIYQYVDKFDTENIEYWKVTGSPTTKTILTESFNSDFELYNIFEEHLDDKGAAVFRYADFQIKKNESSIRINGTVIDSMVFKWLDSEKYQYSINYLDPAFGEMNFLKKRTLDEFVDFTLFETEYETAKFKDEYEMIQLNANEVYKFYQFTYYARNIGMVKYERFYPDGRKVQLELKQILTNDEFEKLKLNVSNN